MKVKASIVDVLKRINNTINNYRSRINIGCENMRVPHVSIVILNWNGHDDTIGCLESLGKLSYPAYSIIVVDNNSSDDSVAMIKCTYPQVTVLESECNLGFAAGCNVGIRHAMQYGADFIWLLNNDTLVFPETLSSMVEVSLGEMGESAVGSVLYNLAAPSEIQTWGGGTVNTWLGRAVNVRIPSKLDYLTAASLLVSREIFENIGFFDERYFLYWEDVEFSCRLRAAGYRLVVAGKSRVLHKGSASLKGNQCLLDTYTTESMIRFLSEHSKYPRIAISIAIFNKLLKRLLPLNQARLRAVCEGVRRYGGRI